MTDRKTWAVVPAAGIGSRFESSLPKQYAQLAGNTVIEHSVGALLESQLFSNIIVVISQSDKWFAENSLAKNKNVMQVYGGDTRAHSVLNGLIALKDRASKNDFVMVHDAARPLLHQEDLFRLAESLKNNGCEEAAGCILAKPIFDTLKQTRSVESGRVVTKTIDREKIWAAQTPQMFRFGVLFSTLQSVLIEAPINPVFEAKGEFLVTDEASAVEYLGHTVKVITSQYENFKITETSDLKLAEFYLAERTKANTNLA